MTKVSKRASRQRQIFQGHLCIYDSPLVHEAKMFVPLTILKVELHEMKSYKHFWVLKKPCTEILQKGQITFLQFV